MNTYTYPDLVTTEERAAIVWHAYERMISRAHDSGQRQAAHGTWPTHRLPNLT